MQGQGKGESKGDSRPTLTLRQKREIERARREAKARQDGLWNEIDRIERELENLKKENRRARQVECIAVNMLNRVLDYDKGQLDFKR